MIGDLSDRKELWATKLELECPVRRGVVKDMINRIR